MRAYSLPIFHDLARRDLHHADGVADHICRALLALRSLGHASIIAKAGRRRIAESRAPDFKLRHYPAGENS